MKNGHTNRVMTGTEGDTVQALTLGLSSHDNRRHPGPCRIKNPLGERPPRNFVIRRGSPTTRVEVLLRSSFNAEKLKYQRPSQLGVYEIRMTVRTTTTNYEKGVN